MGQYVLEEIRFHKFTNQDNEKLHKDSILSIATICIAVLSIGTKGKVSVDSATTTSLTLFQIMSSDSLLRTAVRMGMARPTSKSPALMAKLSLERSLKGFFPPLPDGNRREAGRIYSADTRSRA